MNLRAALRAVAVLLLCTLAPPRAAHADCAATPAADWKTAVSYDYEDFARSSSTSPDDPRWVKFTILLCDPAKVYFQDCRIHQFHYEFGSLRLHPFAGMSPAAFNAATLHATGQQAVLGAVLWPGWDLAGGQAPPPREMAIQLVRQDAYTREQVRDFFNLVKSKVTGATGVTAVYFPTFEQQPSALANSAWLAGEGIPVGDLTRWTRGNRVYSPGWSLGTLKFFPGAQIASAYSSGQLRPEDILLTDGVPAEVPPVSGIVALTPATPNSHAAIISATWDVPFVYLSGPDQSAAQYLVGRRVLLRTKPEYGVHKVTLTDIQDTLPPDLTASLLALKVTPPLQYTPTQPRGAYSTPTGALTPADVRYVGGKAANYGLLRRAIPSNSRVAAAFTFDLWNAYLDQTLSTGRTLRQEIHFRLDQYTWPPTNPAAQAAALSAVRDLFTNTSQTSFTPALQSAVMATLQDPQYLLDPNVKIRFRSSTNVEDTTTFTGAGLYDSFSGCLHDDTDADTSGPSWCDPLEPSERGVFRAIRKVFASFYNDNAFQARRRLGVNEDQVGMGLLCHPSFPDSTEMANGVAILTRTGNTSSISIVSQVGATSITNPDDGSTAEEVLVSIYSFGAYPEVVRQSSRVITGGTVMTWEDDYRSLANLLALVANRHATETGQTSFALDFEFKKTTPSGALEIKQVRPLPAAPSGPGSIPMLINRPQQWCLFQGENSEPFAFHRMKTRISLATDSTWLTPAVTASSFLAPSTFEFTIDCAPITLSGRPSTFPGAAHTFANGVSTDSFRVAGVSNPRTYTLTLDQIPATLPASEPPMLWATDFGYPTRHLATLTATYDHPVPMLNWDDTIITTTTDFVRLCPCPDPAGIPQQRTIVEGPVSIDTAFSWVPGAGAAGYTADLASWTRTIITGLTSRPITLTSPFAQTYRPGHHNFTETYIFDPRLDPGVPRALKFELHRAHVGMLFARAGIGDGGITTLPDDCGLCPLDFTGDRLAGVPDIFAFINAWFAGAEGADFDGLNGIAVADIFAYLNAWFVGC
jgi:hypothetical protein